MHILIAFKFEEKIGSKTKSLRRVEMSSHQLTNAHGECNVLKYIVATQKIVNKISTMCCMLLFRFVCFSFLNVKIGILFQLDYVVIHQSFETTALPLHLQGWMGDSGTYVRGSELLSCSAVPGKCRACDVMQIYPSGIY